GEVRRSSGDGAVGRAGRHPDQEAAVAEIADALEAALGCPVSVAPAGDGYRAQLRFASAAEAVELARRLGRRGVG
ncbi:MAG: ParB/RepB/Spo0J family partition protein, partial [Steroidobacteraceae bacterium]